MDEKSKLILSVVVGPDGRTVLGLGSNVPMEIVCLALLDAKNPLAPRLDIRIIGEDEARARLTPEGARAWDAAHGTPDAPATVRKGSMDAALRARVECPVLVSSGPVADMLSILSDRVGEK